MAVPFLLGGLLALFLGLSPAPARGFTVAFDFNRTTGDRDVNFGEREPIGTFDDNSLKEYFQVSGYLTAVTTNAPWILLNDPNSDVLDAVPPTDAADMKVGTNVVVRTRLENLTSSTGGEGASGGFLFGMTGSGTSQNGFIARVDRNPSGNVGVLFIDRFTNGQRGANLVTSTNFNYGINTTPWFLELRVTGDGFNTNATLRIFSDGQIPGSGQDSNRLSDPLFESLTPTNAISATLSGYSNGFLGLYFEDNSNHQPGNPAGGSVRYSNFYAHSTDDTTNPPIPISLTNLVYGVGLAANGTVRLTHLASGRTADFEPDFKVLYSAVNPVMANSNVADDVNFDLPSWIKNGVRTSDLFAAAPSVVQCRAATAVLTNNQIVWSFTNSGLFTFSASLELPSGAGEPGLTFGFVCGSNGWFMAGFTGAPENYTSSLEWLWQPLVWQGKRFPVQSCLTPEYLCSLPATLVGVNGGTVGVAADPAQMPFRLPTLANSRFGVAVRNAAGKAQPMIFAPVFGGANSLFTAGSSFDFKLRLLVRPGGFYDTFRHVATNSFQFTDYRRNAVATLNQALDNMSDYFLSPWAMWHDPERGFDGLRDNPGTLRQESLAHIISFALVRDSQQLFHERALPTLEYFLSRSRTMLSLATYDPDEAMFGPIDNSADFIAAHQLAQGRTPYLANIASNLESTLLSHINVGTTYNRAQSLDNARNYLRPLLAMYRLTKNTTYLNQARKAADDYITWRINQPQPDFYDARRSSFWTQIGPMWVDLLELADETGDAGYRDAALAAAQEFVGYNYFCPAIPNSNITVNIGGSVSGMPIPEETVPAWRLSEAGLQCEAAGTSLSHRGIFMVSWSPYLLRLFGASGDSFLRDVARSVVVGRYANFPGYNEKTVYTTIYEKPDYPLQPYTNLTYNSFHFHHPMHMALQLIDFLVAEAGLRSQGRIHFPARYSAASAYFQQKVYGDRPGAFYTDTNVWLWLPQALLTSSDLQVNHVAGHGNGNVYVALMNQSNDVVTTTITLNAARAPFGASHPVRIWTNGDLQDSSGALINGQMTVSIPPKGVTALAIDGLAADTEIQHQLIIGSPPLGPRSTASTTAPQFGKVQGALLSFGTELTSAYVWLQACPANATDARSGPLQQARLNYSINGGPTNVLVDSSWPFDFSVPLAADARSFAFFVQGVSPANQTNTSARLTLFAHDSYTNWAAANFTSGELANPAISGSTADPDHDRQVNFMEYAFLTNPKVTNSPAVLNATLSNGVVYLGYTRNAQATDVLFVPEASTNLVTWTNEPDVVQLVNIVENTNGTETVTLRDAGPMEPGAKYFRLRLTYLP